MQQESGKDSPQLNRLLSCWAFAEASQMPMALVESTDFIFRRANPAFCRLVGVSRGKIEGSKCTSLFDSDCLSLLERVYRTGNSDTHIGTAGGSPPYSLSWSYAVWPAVFEEGPSGLIVQITESTPLFHQITAMNQELVVSSIRQHEFTAEATRREAEALQEQRHLTERLQQTNEELFSSRAQLKDLSVSLLHAQEEERRRLARDLHDDLAQRLASLEMELTVLRRQPSPWDEALLIATAHVSDISAEIRRISHNLHPAALEIFGLEIALRSLCEEWEDRANLPMHFSCSPLSHPVPLPVATTLYRITQEAIRNVQKHAGDARVIVTVSESPQSLCLTISDDGKGFVLPESHSQMQGLGLISMHERAAIVGGRLELHSAPDEGTLVRVQIPLYDQP